MNKNSLKQIKKDFPYQHIEKYNEAYGKSLYLFSKTKFKYKVTFLDWVNPEKSLLNQNKYRKKMYRLYKSEMDTFTRKYVVMSITLKGIDYKFVFFHLNNPWVLFIKKLHLVKASYEMLFGSKNPLYNQIMQIKHELKKDLGPNYRQSNVVLVGDSNCPELVSGMTPKCFDLMKSILPLVKDSKGIPTYPARGSSMYLKVPSIKIDHVQSSRHLILKSKVLNLEGSDHRAIEIEILD